MNRKSIIPTGHTPVILASDHPATLAPGATRLPVVSASQTKLCFVSEQPDKHLLSSIQVGLLCDVDAKWTGLGKAVNDKAVELGWVERIGDRLKVTDNGTGYAVKHKRRVRWTVLSIHKFIKAFAHGPS